MSSFSKMMPICIPSDGCDIGVNNVTGLKPLTGAIMDKKLVPFY